MFSRLGRRGRPSKNAVTEKSRLINNTSLVKKPKYLSNVENKNKRIANLSNNSSPANSDASRKGNNSKKRKAKPKLAKTRSAKKSYYSDYTEDKYSEYHYGSDFGEDSSSDHEELISESELEDFDQRDDNTDSDYSISSFSTTSNTNKKVVYPRNPTPEPIWLRNEEIPSLTLPKSSDDLLLPKPYVMQALSVYEVLRHFRSIVRLTPFRFEDFCSAIISEEQTNLLAEIHLNLIRSILREEDSQQTHFGALDQKDSVNSVLYFMDMFTWPEVLRSYVESDSTFDAPLLQILTSCEYPYTNIENRLKILMFLTDQFLITNRVREDLVHEGGFQYEDHCRCCHKVGDLLCCETCPAVYHLECVEPPLMDVPLDDWQCSLCKSQQLMGVTDCISDVEKSGLLSRHEPLGFDRHGRKYWFISRRIFIENEGGDCWYYSTVLQFNELLEMLDTEVYETALCREIEEFKSEICRQMEITEKLTNQFKGNRKSHLDVENDNILKIQKQREEEKEKGEGDKGADDVDKTDEDDGEMNNKNETEEEEMKEDDEDNAADEEKGTSEEMSKSRKRDIVTRSKTGSLLPRTFNMDDLKKRSSLVNSKGEIDKMDISSESPPCNDNALTKLTKSKSQLVNGSAYKLGMDTRNYVNQYTVNPLAMNKAQKQEERDKKRHMSYKFSLTNAAEFKWTTSLFGNRSQLVSALRQGMLHLENNIPLAFMHTNWYQLRKTWISAVNNCLLAKDFIQAIMVLQACAKPVIFAPVWHDQLGHTKLCRLTALEREERKRIEKKEKKDKEDEEEKNRLMCSHVKYSLGLKNQVFKQKGEEYRIHGQWAWIWISWARNYQFVDSRTIGLAAGPAKYMVEVTDGNGPRIITVEGDTYEQLMQNVEETRNSNTSNNEQKGELLWNLKKLVAKPPCREYNGIIDVSSSFASPARLKYPKIAKASKLDDLLTRRIQLKLKEENTLKAKRVNDVKVDRSLEMNQKELSILKKQITSLKGRYSYIMDQSRQHTCYTRGCGPVNNFPCYSPLCQRRNKMRAELWTLLQRINALYKEKAIIEAKSQNAAAEECDTKVELGSLESLKNAIGKKMNLAQEEVTKSEENDVKTDIIPKEEIKEEIKEEPTIVMNDICNEVEIGATEVITESATGEVKRIKTNRNMKVPMAVQPPPPVIDNTPTRGKSAFYAKRRLMKPTVIKPDLHFGRNTKIVPIAAINADPNERITRRISVDRLADTTMYSTTDTTQKIYLKKLTKDNKKKENQVKYPPTSTFRTPSKKSTLFVLQSCELKRLARQAGRKHATGFSYLARPNVSTWIYPCPRPTFRTCWLYRTTKATTISAVGLHFRILWTCLKWDDMQMKPPAFDYKHHIKTETESITKEILKKRTTGRFDEITEYLIKKIVVPIDLPKKVREITPSRVGLRKRKREEAPETSTPQITETWVDESTLELWEIKHFGDRAEREAMQLQTQSMLRPRPLLNNTNKYEVKSDSPVLINGKNNNNVQYTLLRKGLTEGTPISMKSLLSSQNGRKYPNLSTPTTSSGILKLLTKEEASKDPTLHKITMSAPPLHFNNRTSSSTLNTLLSNLKEPNNGTPNTTTDKPMPRKIFMTKGPDGKSRMISASSLSLIKVANADGSSSFPSNMQRKGLQKIQISKGEDGKLQVKGLFAGQKLVQMADGKLHVMNTHNNSQSSPNNVVIANATTPNNHNWTPKKSDLQGKMNNSQFSTTPILRKIMSSDVNCGYSRTPNIQTTRMEGNNRNVVQLTTNSKGTISATINGQQVILRPTNIPDAHNTSKLKTQLVLPIQKDVDASYSKATTTKVQFEMKGNGISCSEALKEDLTPEQEEGLLRQHPPGTVIKCITSQVVESQQGPRIVLQGLQCSEFTPAQLHIVQQHVKTQLLKVQQEAGTEVILGPTKIYLAVQPTTVVVKKEQPDVEHKENIVDGIGVDVDINGRPWSLAKSPRKRGMAAVIEDEIRNKKMLLDEENAKNRDVSENKRIFHMDVSLIRKKEILKKDILKKRATLEKKLQVQVEDMNETPDELVCKKTLEQVTNAQTTVAKRGRPFKVKPVEDTSPQSVQSSLETTPVKESPKRGRHPKYSATPNKTPEEPVNKHIGGRLKRTQEPTATTTASGKPKGTPGRPRKKGRHGTATPDNGKTKKEQLLCLCRTPYDDTKFYVGCDLCNNWFHGDCVGITEDMISTLSEFICSECTHARETQELYCLCRTPYDESQFYICCDTCQDWFHGGCVGILQAEADSIDEYICPNCQKNDSINSANLKNLTSSDFETLKKLLRQIQSHKSAWPFMEAVRADEAPDYYKVIKHPMDLRIIEKRILEKRYKKLGDFIADVTKIFDNCRYYNPKDSSVYKCAESLEGFFVSKVKSLRDKLADAS